MIDDYINAYIFHSKLPKDFVPLSWSTEYLVLIYQTDRMTLNELHCLGAASWLYLPASELVTFCNMKTQVKTQRSLRLQVKQKAQFSECSINSSKPNSKWHFIQSHSTKRVICCISILNVLKRFPKNRIFFPQLWANLKSNVTWFVNSWRRGKSSNNLRQNRLVKKTTLLERYAAVRLYLHFFMFQNIIMIII